MSNLHCHSCDWGQDDFYTKRYNLKTKIFSDIRWLWNPRIIKFDTYIIDDLIKYTKVPVIRKSNNGQTKVFSWNWLVLELIKDIKIHRKMKWKTWEDWKQDEDTAVCPNCGERNFDID